LLTSHLDRQNIGWGPPRELISHYLSHGHVIMDVLWMNATNCGWDAKGVLRENN